jgi:methylmalonic aciduria homocystinuria type C protein
MVRVTAFAKPDESWRDVTRRVAELCRPHGFDLVHPFCVRWYNELNDSPELALPDLNRQDALGLVIANTRALWPAFSAALGTDPQLAAEPNPLDCYTTKTLHAVLAGIEARAIVRFAHTMEPTPLPIQRIAHAAGFAHLSPSHLSVHSEHGPWIALRAVLVVDVAGPECIAEDLPDPCERCERPCLPALDRAIRRTRESLAMDPERLDWRAWVDVRDACPVGLTSRYSDDQIEYHYGKLRVLLGW